MLEAVMVLPSLLLIMSGTIEFGIAFGRYQIISHSARIGVREAALFRSNCDPLAARAEVENVIRLSGNGLGMFPGDLQIDIQGLCTATNSRVEVTYRHNLILLPRVGVLPNPYIDLTSISLMRNES